MKITERKCPTCGGVLKIDAGQKVVQCEYCGNEYTVDTEPEQQKPEGPKRPQWEMAGPDRTPEPETSRAGRIAIALFVLCVVILAGVGVYRKAREEQADRWKEDQWASIESDAEEWKRQNQVNEAGNQHREEEGTLSGMLGGMVAVAFGKDAASVTAEELARIQWIGDKWDTDHKYMGYSFENPMENPDAELTWVTFPYETDTGYGSLYLCSGLKVLDTRQPLSQCNLRGILLENLSAPLRSLEEAAEAVDDPGTIRKLSLSSQIEDMENLALFPNLEILSINARELQNIDQVVALGSLRSLTIENGDSLSDFSVFAAMGSLEELSIESENLKSLEFLKRMPQLKSLSLSDGKLLDLNGLEALAGLEKLTVTDCGELQDMEGVTALTGLKELHLEKPYGCAEPSLAGLTSLKSLTLEYFDDCTFLSSLTELESLTLQGSDLSSGVDLSGLTQLKRLVCTSRASDTDLSFVQKLSSLESVDLGGMGTYDDISGIFALPNLKELILNGMECEIAFDKVAENTSLESLEMAGVKLYENVKVSGGGGIVYVDWDDVFLADHLDFFQKFPNLRRLGVADNEIKDLEFAGSLMKLEEIDLSDNYVTDLRPLASLPALRLVDCKGNPISNLRVLDDAQVHVVSE